MHECGDIALSAVSYKGVKMISLFCGNRNILVLNGIIFCLQNSRADTKADASNLVGVPYFKSKNNLIKIKTNKQI